MINVVPFTDDSQFTQEGMVKLHNLHEWANENPHSTLVLGHQRHFTVKIWAGILGDYLLGPYMLASSTQMANVQNILGSSPPEIIGGSTSRDQKENVVST